MRRPVLLIVCLSLLRVSASAQDHPKQPPTFAASTGLVLVDFVVTRKGDQIVGGLTEKDFIVKEDGKERPIVSFKAFGGKPAVAQAGPQDVVIVPFPPEEAPPPPPPADAVAVLFVDDGQLSPQEAVRLRPALKSLINTIADRNGALALVAPWSKISLAEEVEGNRAVFTAAADKITGRRFDEHSTFPISDAEAFLAERGDPAMLQRLTLRFVSLNPGFDENSAMEAARSRALEVSRAARNRRVDAYGVLAKSLNWLARQPGRHSVVMVSGGYAADPEDDDERDIVDLSARANAPIHFLDARGLQGIGLFQGVEYGPSIDREAGETPFAFSDAAAGSTDLALDTGGLIVRNTNDLSKGLTRLLDTMTTYYVIGYEPPGGQKKPGFRKIKVEIRTKGLDVVARRGYYDRGTAKP